MTDYLGQISIQLARAVIRVIIVVGVVGNCINIIVLSRSTLFNHSCSRYFLALSVSSLCYSSINLIYRLLADGYQIDPARYSTFACKTITYITQLCFPMAPYFIVLASLDRFCASSASIKVRNFSNIRVTRLAILVVVCIFTLLYVNTPIIVDLRSDGLGCRNRGDTVHKQVYAVLQCVVFAIVAPILMIIFGLLTICNAKQLGDGRIQASRHRRTERQLVFMLLMQVGTHILLTLPMAIIYTLLVLPTAYKATRLTYFAYSISNLPFHLSYASAFPLYFLSGRIYRQEFIHLLRRTLKLGSGTRIAPITESIGTMTMRGIAQT